MSKSEENASVTSRLPAIGRHARSGPPKIAVTVVPPRVPQEDENLHYSAEEKTGSSDEGLFGGEVVSPSSSPSTPAPQNPSLWNVCAPSGHSLNRHERIGRRSGPSYGNDDRLVARRHARWYPEIQLVDDLRRCRSRVQPAARPALRFPIDWIKLNTTRSGWIFWTKQTSEEPKAALGLTR